MKRVGPWLFNFAMLVSLVLGAGTMVLCVYSFWNGRTDHFRWRGLMLSVFVGRGEVTVDLRHPTPAPTTLPTSWIPTHSGITGRISPQGMPESMLEHEYVGIGYGQPASQKKQEQETVQGLKKVAVRSERELADLRYEIVRSIEDGLGIEYLNRIKAAEADHTAFLGQVNARLAELTPVSRIGFPLWSVVLLAGIVLAIWIGRLMHHRRQRRKGLCVICGYDLRATPDRCPECGTIPATTIAQSE